MNVLQAIDDRENRDRARAAESPSGAVETAPTAENRPWPAAAQEIESPSVGAAPTFLDETALQSRQGALTATDCSGPHPVMHVSSTEGEGTFAIDQLNNVVIRGQEGEAEFVCGPQDDRPVRTEFDDPLEASHADGRIRVIEFLPAR